MKLRISWLTCAACLGSALNAAVSSPDQLLPGDTLAVFSVPDCAAAGAAWKDQALVRLWNDPAVRPFREKFEQQWGKEVSGPLEERLGLRLADQLELFRGQLTFALVGNGWPQATGKKPGWLLALDTRDREAQLTARLAAWKTNLTEAGRKVRPEKIGESEFSVISLHRDDLAGAPGTDGGSRAGEDGGIEVWFGQSGSVLWLGDQRQVLEQALARQAGNAGSALKSNPDFVSAFEAGLGSAQAYGWVHLQPLVRFASNLAASGGSDDGAMGLLDPSKLLPALGLRDLRSLSFSMSSSTGGMTAELRMGIPESSRTGLFKMLLPGRKPAGPPAFVSSEITRFQRLRVDLKESWSALEGTVYSILPTARSVVELMFQSVGKDQDPNYDLRRELIGNLGDDVMILEPGPTTNKLDRLDSASTLILIGTASPDKVAGALRTLSALLPPPMNLLREREVDGRKVYSLALPGDDGAGAGAPTKWFSFGAGAGYLALSGDSGLLEEFLRGSDPRGKPLSDREGLREAAVQVGGMDNGWFGYEDDRAVAQSMIEALKRDAGSIEGMLAFTPAGEALAKSGGLKAWADFTLLPPFEQIAGYFHFTVYGLDLRAEGFSYRMFSPTPPPVVHSPSR
jgi:hypothetical protein